MLEEPRPCSNAPALFETPEGWEIWGSRKLKASIIEDDCFGCGSCVVGCEPGALLMKVVQPPEFVPGAVA